MYPEDAAAFAIVSRSEKSDPWSAEAFVLRIVGADPEAADDEAVFRWKEFDLEFMVRSETGCEGRRTEDVSVSASGAAVSRLGGKRDGRHFSTSCTCLSVPLLKGRLFRPPLLSTPSSPGLRFPSSPGSLVHSLAVPHPAPGNSVHFTLDSREAIVTSSLDTLSHTSD